MRITIVNPRQIRLIVRGPADYFDSRFIFRELDEITQPYNDVILISDMKPDQETRIQPSSFPLAEQWLNRKWHMHAKRSKGQAFKRIERYACPYSGEKKWTKGVKERRIEMIQNADLMVCFVDFEDEETESMMELAEIFNLPTIKVFI